MTVLLVDDDEDDRDIFQEALAMAKPDCNLIFATNGEDALRVLKSLQSLPDIVFLDVNMPLMDGRQLLGILKADPRFSAVPVVVYSTSSHKSELGEFFRMGASNFITKPSEFRLLISYLESILR